MDSKLANQFIIAASTIFKKVGNVTLKKTGLEYFPKGTKISAGIATILGITGDYKGQFIIVLDEDMALKIATAILMGVPVTTYDEIAESAVSEIGNMIGGEASRLLQEGGYICDLSVPSIARGKEMEIAFYPASPLFSIKFESDWGEIKIILRLEEK
ncbi:MAG: chemotaxis protein CheX [Candidatus Riflebacteria bacterium]